MVPPAPTPWDRSGPPGCFFLSIQRPTALKSSFYGSLCKTGVGHGTDRVLREVLQEVDAEIVFSKEDPVGIQHPNTMDFFAYQGPNQTGHIRVESVGGGDIVILGRPADPSAEIYPENSFAEVRDFCKWRYINTLSEYVEMNEGPEIWDFLREVWKAMQQSITDGLSTTGILPGGLNVERKAKQLYENQLPTEVAQVLECRIMRLCLCRVGAKCGQWHHRHRPTCGAAGVLPSVLRYVQEARGCTEEQVLRAPGHCRHSGEPGQKKRLHLRRRMRLPGRGGRGLRHGRRRPGRPLRPQPGSGGVRRRNRPGASPGPHLRPHLRPGPGPLHRTQRREPPCGP